MSEHECNNPFHDHSGEDGEAKMRAFRAARHADPLSPEGTEITWVALDDMFMILDDMAQTATRAYMETGNPAAMIGMQVLGTIRGVLGQFDDVIEETEQHRAQAEQEAESLLREGWEDDLEARFAELVAEREQVAEQDATPETDGE